MDIEAQAVAQHAGEAPTKCSCKCSPAPSWENDPAVPIAMRTGRTFAERRAQTVTHPSGPRLVSLGPSEHVQRNNHGGYDLVPVELFVDHDRRNDFYVLTPGHDRPIRLNDHDQRSDEVTKLPPLPAGQRRFSRPDNGRPASPPDPPPVRIVGDNPLYTPNA